MDGRKLCLSMDGKKLFGAERRKNGDLLKEMDVENYCAVTMVQRLTHTHVNRLHLFCNDRSFQTFLSTLTYILFIMYFTLYFLFILNCISFTFYLHNYSHMYYFFKSVFCSIVCISKYICLASRNDPPVTPCDLCNR